MKRLILIIMLSFLLIGCQSKEQLFTKTCIIKVNSKDLKDTIKEEITYNNMDELKQIKRTRKYESKNIDIIKYIKNSTKDYNNNLLENKNIKIKIIRDEKNKYSLKYFYDIDKMKKIDLDNLNINKNSIKYLKRLKKEGFKCQ